MNTQAPIERIIISLTSIKAREAALKETCTSLVQQDFDAHYEVRVNLSHEPYLMDEGFADAPVWVADLQKLNSRCTLQVSFVRNTGPYRKLLPVLAEFFDNTLDCIIVTCDDDTNYVTTWLTTLLDYHRRTGGLVAYRGHALRKTAEAMTLLPYVDWQRNPDKTHHSLANLPTGKDGVVYRPSYFDRSVLDEDMAMKLAPTADDLWFRWHSLIRGIPCYLVDLGDFVFDSVPSFEKEKSLWEVYNKKGGNDRTVAILEQHFRTYLKTDVATVLCDYWQHISQVQLPPLTSNCLTPSLLAAKQVRILSLLNKRTDVEQALSARSYEFFRLKKYIKSEALDVNQAKEPRTDRGGMRYAIESVDRFDQAYGWMSHQESDTGATLVSVIMTTFNAQDTVRWAVNSVLAQDHRHLELIIVDDVSSDSTREILQNLSKESHCIRLFFLKKNRGTYFAKNVGLRKALGDYVTFQDSDDWSHPARIRLQTWRLKRSGKLATRCSYVRHHAMLNQLVKVNGRVESPGFITLMARRDLFEQFGYFDCSRRAADDELICRLKALHGEGSVDTFSLPAYVALYSDQSLIADSSSYSSSEGIRFMLGEEREHYKQSYIEWHMRLQEDVRLLENYCFPPQKIFIDKAETLKSFGDNEIADLWSEVDIEEVGE